MQKKYDALMCNNTWSLVDLPPGVKVIGSRLLFKTKEKDNGSLKKHKYRLVAQDFLQIESLDYVKTFGLAVKMITLRIFLTLAVHFNWKICQLDINNTFLNGYI